MRYHIVTTAVLLALGATPALSEPIRIGAVYPMTGPVAFDGETLLRGARIAIDEINANGGVLGRPLELVVEDGACVPAQSVSAAEKLVTANKVTGLVGAFCSSSTGAVMEVASRYKIPLVAGISTAPDITERGNEFIFRIPATSAMLSAAFADPMMSIAGGTRFSFLVVNDDWGRSIVESYSKALGAKGASIVDTQIYITSESDLFPYITNIKRDEPNGLVLAGNTQNAAALTEQIRQLGINSKLFGEGSFTAKPYYDLVGDQGDGIYGLMAYVHTSTNPKNQAFVEKYQAAYNDLPTTFSASGYNEVSVIAAAIAKAGSVEPTAIRDALREVEVEGLSGQIRFTEKGQGYGFNVYLTINENASPIVEQETQIAKPE